MSEREELLMLLVDVYSGERGPVTLTPQLAKRLFEQITRVTVTTHARAEGRA